MKWRILAATVLAAMTGGCDKKAPADSAATASTDGLVAAPAAVAQRAKASPDAPHAAAAAAATNTGAAFIAYSYTIAFEIAARRLDDVVAAHRAACDALGAGQCQLLNSSRRGDEADGITASLDLRLAPAAAKPFEARLRSTVAEAGGRLLASDVAGDDLTRQIIDADAALKAKRTLRDRLQTLLERRDGKLADLLEVEKALSQTQQELDSATALLAELRQRVSFSKFTISYRSERPIGSTTARPLANAIADAGQTLSASLALLLTICVAVLPWLVPVALVAVGLRWRARRRARDG